MSMSPGLRKATLTAHIALSVGWLGAVVAYAALAIAALNATDLARAHGLYVALDLLGWRVLVPLSLGALASGLLQALGTEWGLFRHYWIVAKLGLTCVGTAVLLGHMRTVGRVPGLVEQLAEGEGDLGRVPLQLVVHAVGGGVILLLATVLSVWKPRGRTPFGRRRR